MLNGFGDQNVTACGDIKKNEHFSLHHIHVTEATGHFQQ